MRVIAGTARGTRLISLDGEAVTRPTLDRVKEGMFSAVQFLLPGAKVLDLFAGSGQLGIEALSRGAQSCVFIDQNAQANTVIQQNLKAAGLFKQARVARIDAFAYLASCKEQFDIVLIDPPYHEDTAARCLPLLESALAAGAAVLTETEREAVLPERAGRLQKAKEYAYGTVKVTRYTLCEE